MQLIRNMHTNRFGTCTVLLQLKEPSFITRIQRVYDAPADTCTHLFTSIQRVQIDKVANKNTMQTECADT